MTIKPCKICGKKRYANLSICFSCYKAREKAKKEEKAKRKLEKKQTTKKYQESIKKVLFNKCWKLISEIVRRQEANADGYTYCYTCNKVIHWKEANCGHFKHGRLDLEFRNLKCQCVGCNKHNSGRLDVYASNLIRDYGLEWFRKLEADAYQDLGYSIDELQTKYKELLEIKNNLDLK